MDKETRSERKLTGQEITAKIAGFFDGKLDEIEEEIQEVEKWPTNVRLGPKIKRKDQEIESLSRVLDELTRVKKCVLGALGFEIEDSESTKPTPTL